MEIMFVVLGICALRGAVAFMRDLIGRKPRPFTRADALAMLREPRPTVDGDAWMCFECRPVACEPPSTQGQPPKIIEPTQRKAPAR